MKHLQELGGRNRTHIHFAGYFGFVAQTND